MRSISIIIAVMAMCATNQAEEGPSTNSTSSRPPQGSKEPTHVADKTGKHLFILSGQSNMANMDPKISFIPAVEAAFGKDNVTVVKSAEGGVAMRYWDKDYKLPEDRAEKMGRNKSGTPKEFGANYDLLIKAITKATAGKSYDTVTLVWMQGETDAGQRLTELYLDSFQRFLTRLKSDLKIDSIHIVIGRLSDWGLDLPKEKTATEKMREIQVKYAEEHPNCAWIDTDDLNNDEKKGNVLHYTEEGYKILGERFSEKAIGLIAKQKTDK
jgi:Carbohydrate esterase, sialic acid-specific acetylesterase